MVFKKETEKTAETAPEAKAESPRERFLRLAPTRTEAAIKKVSLLGNLAGPSYQYESAEIDQMIAAVSETLDEVKTKFDKKLKGKRKGFSFVRNRPRAVA